MFLTATHVNYFQLCHRKVWLFSNNIQMEHTSDIVAEGKLIGETSYGQRAAKYTELELEGIKIDFYDAKNRVVHEVKKSNKVEQAHEWQLKYYLYVLKQNGIADAKGILEYPKLKERKDVFLLPEDETIEQMKAEITNLLTFETPPPVINKTICKKCSYYDFCYS